MRFIATKTFTLPSWDKKPVPLPFSRVIVVFGEPIVVTDSNLEEAAKLVVDRMTNR